ncbi:MAG: hypothetical protein IPN34_12875 [Planctomycetes bacterium]|nr:hypothetical protein [Planctomycetota bacterium]
MNRLPAFAASLCLALPAFLAPLARTQDEARPTAPPFSLLGARFEGLFVDGPTESGAIWARGTTYKLGFEKGRATYVPLFGSRAPRGYPLELELRSLRCGEQSLSLAPPSAPQVEGARISIERSPLVETWDLEPERAEQSFVLDAPLGTGALELRLALRTDLLLREQRDGELVFEQPGLGVVRYGEAVAIDARGARAPLALALEGGEIALHVPAEFLARASYPLVIDPVLRTFAVDTSANDTTDPDVCYDATSDTWLVVCREVVAQGDGDIKCLRVAGNGSSVLDVVYAEASTSDALHPATANHRRTQTFLVGWITQPASAPSQLFVRERTATSTVQGASRFLHGASVGTRLESLDIGGSRLATANFAVVFREASILPTSNAGFFALAQSMIVPRGGAAASLRLLSSELHCTGAPRISEDSGTNDLWLATWAATSAPPCSGQSIRFAILRSNGALEQAETTVSGTTAGRDTRPVAASEGTRFFVCWQRDDAIPRTQSDIAGTVVGLQFGIWARISPVFSLTQIEPGTTLAADQTAPSIAFDGCRYLYAYSESSSGGAPRPHGATFALIGVTLSFLEGHRVLTNAAAGVAHSSVRVATLGSTGAAPGLGMAVWQQIGNGGRDLGAAHFDIRATSGGVSSVATQCPSRTLGTDIACIGTPALGRTIRLELSSVAGTPLLMVGLPMTPVPLCTTFAATCSLGVAQPAAVVLPAAGLSLVIPCEPQLVGATAAAQGLDLGAGLGCPTAVFGLAFRTTDTLHITVQ